MKKAVLVILLVICTFFVISYSLDKNGQGQKKIVDTQAAREDIEQWINCVSRVHPALINSAWRESAQEKAEGWLSNIGAEVSTVVLAEFLNALVFNLKDAHTRVDSYSMFWSKAWSGQPIFPLVLSYQNGAYRVFKTSEANKHLSGQIVRSINGYSMDLLEEHLSKFPGDSIDMSRHQLAQNIAAILFLYWGEYSEFRVGLEGQNISIKAAQISDINTSSIFHPTYVFEPDSAILNIPSFAIDSKMLQPFLLELAQSDVEEIVIDVRGNSGGNGGVAAYLLSRISNKPIYSGTKQWYFSQAYQELALANEFRRRNVPLWFGLHKVLPLTWFTDWEVNEAGYVIQERTLMYHNPEQKDYKITVLVDENTASAAVDLASYVQDNQIGQVYGAPTYAHASYYGEIAPIILDNSRISGQISSSFYTRPSGDDSKQGIIPDRFF